MVRLSSLLVEVGVAHEETRVRKSGVKVGIQEVKSMFLFSSNSLSSYFRPWGDNEGHGFVNIISGILQLQSAIIYGLNFNNVRANKLQKDGKHRKPGVQQPSEAFLRTLRRLATPQ